MNTSLRILSAVFMPLVLACSAWAGPLDILINGTPRALYKEQYALLIGASDYRSGSWDSLDNIPKELNELGDVLSEQGFSVTYSPNPKGSDLYSIIRSFIVDYGDKDTALLIVFSGHGWTDPESSLGYVIATDAPNPETDRIAFRKKAVSMSEMRTLADLSTARHTLFVFDSCFSGSIFSTRAEPFTPKPSRDDIAYFDELKRPAVQIFTSGDKDQRVPSISRFMPAFVSAIEGKVGSDLDRDGRVSMKEIAFFFQQRVTIQPQTPQFGALGDGTGGDFVFQPKGLERAVGLEAVENLADANVLYSKALPLLQSWQEAKQQEGLALLKKAVEAGHPAAQYELAILTAEGIGDSPPDSAESLRLLRSAAGKGYADAQVELGLAYSRGLDVQQSYSEAVRYYRLAADQRSPTALYNLAIMHAEGRGVGKDDEKAVALYRMSAEQGYAYGQVAMGIRLLEGRGVPKDAAEAAKYFGYASAQGDQNASYQLGTLYASGNGVGLDLVKAGSLFSGASEIEAAREEALRLVGAAKQLEASPSPSDVTLAAQLYGALNLPEALYRLGLMYEQGRGVVAAPAEGLRKIKCAAQRGYGPASDLLSERGIEYEGAVRKSPVFPSASQQRPRRVNNC